MASPNFWIGVGVAGYAVYRFRQLQVAGWNDTSHDAATANHTSYYAPSTRLMGSGTNGGDWKENVVSSRSYKLGNGITQYEFKTASGVKHVDYVPLVNNVGAD